MRARITGLGEWVGERSRTNADFPEEVVATWRARLAGEKQSQDATLVSMPEDVADRASLLGFMRDAEDPFVGAKHRFVADPSTRATEAGAHAARAALEDARLDAREVDVVISWDAVPDRPGVPGAPKVAHLVGAHRAYALEIQVGCASTIVQLELALGLIESGRARHVLCTQSHLAHRTFTPTTPISAHIGDVATAYLVGASETSGVLATRALSDGSYHDAVVFARGKDDETDTPWWTAGPAFHFGTRDRVRAQEMMRETVRMGATTIGEACERARIAPSTIDVVASTHPRSWIPGAIAETLGLAPEKAVCTYERLAHVGGCGVISNLIEARRRGLLREGAIVALYAQGLGFTRSAALLRW